MISRRRPPEVYSDEAGTILNSLNFILVRWPHDSHTFLDNAAIFNGLNGRAKRSQFS